MDFEIKFVEAFHQEGVAFMTVVDDDITIDDIGHSDKVVHIGCREVREELQRMQNEIDNLSRKNRELEELSLRKADEDWNERSSQGIFG